MKIDKIIKIQNNTITKYIAKYVSDDTKNMLIGILSIFVSIWLLFYFIPSIFVSLFHTFLGNIIILLSVILISAYNYKHGILIAIIFIILSRFSYLSDQQQQIQQQQNIKEGFQWNQKKTEDFLRTQRTLNYNTIFDVEELQKQASEQEVDYFLQHSMWPWSKETVNLYEAHALNNTYIQNTTKNSANQARRIYNETAILQVLSQQSKEGQFLLNGVEVNTGINMIKDGVGSFGYNSGLIGNLYNPIYRCGQDKKTGTPVMKRFQYIGDDKMLGNHTTKIENVNVKNLEQLIPGFTFLNKPCDPCLALQYDANQRYTCPFELKIKKNKGPISAIWEYLWSLNRYPITNPQKNAKEINANKFELPGFVQS